MRRDMVSRAISTVDNDSKSIKIDTGWNTRLGEIVDGDELIFIIAKASKTAGVLKGPVVGTLMSNLGMEYALKKLNTIAI
jgi:phosphomannomutase